MNAEKLLKAEDDTALCELIKNAEYLYADGISMVRAIRRKYPQAELSRVAGADLWEALMQRAGQQGHQYFWLAVSLMYWLKPRRNCVPNGT